MSHTPWTQEEAEKWAMESDAIRKATFEDDAIEGFKAGMAKAAEVIEACETVHGGENNMGTLSWSPSRMNNDTHSAKLVGVRTIDSDESGSKDQ